MGSGEIALTFIIFLILFMPNFLASNNSRSQFFSMPYPRKSLFGTSVDLKYKDHYSSNYDEALENLFKQIPNCNEAKEKLIAMDAQKPKYRYFQGTIETSFADHFPLVSQAKCLVAQKRAFEEAAKAGLTKEQCKLNRIGLFQFGDPAFSACNYSNTGYPGYPREYLNAEVFCQFN